MYWGRLSVTRGGTAILVLRLHFVTHINGHFGSQTAVLFENDGFAQI